MATRLSALVRFVGRLHPNQCGFLLSLSSFDTCTTLVHTICTLQRPCRKVSSLFLDIKGGFNNIDVCILCSSLCWKGIAQYLVSWFRFLLSDRTCRLLFQASLMVFAPVSLGTPQCSPIPPLLLVIYVAPLHISLSHGLVLFYLDDFALTTTSSSYRTNFHSLQATFGRISAIAHARKIDLSVPKTELMHWRTPVHRDPTSASSPPPLLPWTANSSPLLSSLDGWATGFSLLSSPLPTFPAGCHFRRLRIAISAGSRLLVGKSYLTYLIASRTP